MIIVEFDGIEYQVEIHQTGADTLDVVVNGQTHKVSIKDLQGQSGVKPIVSKAAPPPSAKSRSPQAVTPQTTSIHTDVVTAPMPGDIQAISVKAGDRVSTGQELLVLEAMKMKNVIRSPQDGQVTSVEVLVGQSVKFGEPLIRFG